MKLITYIISIVFLILIIIGCNDSNLKEIYIYYKNGKLREKYFVDQNKLIQGVRYKYYMNGHLKEVRHYYYGEFNGEFKDYFPNGKLKTKGKFKNNVQIDTTFNYLDNGHLDVIVLYDKNSNTIKEISFFPNGKVHIMRSYFVDGSGQINAYKTHFENGMINEKESKFVEIKYLNLKKDSIYVKLYNPKYLDSIKVNIIRDFNFDVYSEPKILRTIKFNNTKELKFIIKDSDFVKGTINIQIQTEKWNFRQKKIEALGGYDIQFNKGVHLPKDNIEGIYRL